MANNRCVMAQDVARQCKCVYSVEKPPSPCNHVFIGVEQQKGLNSIRLSEHAMHK